MYGFSNRPHLTSFRAMQRGDGPEQSDEKAALTITIVFLTTI